MGAGPGDNVGVSMKGLPKGNMPRDGDIMVKKSDTEFKACETFVVQAMVLDHPGQHTPSNPCVGKVFSIEMHHREHEKAGPGDNVGVSMKGLPKGNMPRDGDIMVKKSDTEFKAC